MMPRAPILPASPTGHSFWPLEWPNYVPRPGANVHWVLPSQPDHLQGLCEPCKNDSHSPVTALSGNNYGCNQWHAFWKQTLAAIINTSQAAQTRIKSALASTPQSENES